ncbi:MAG: hypothetical protein Q8R30_01675 [bacterium]|nr:hypothetical protein [bacterium]MDZ4285721.1 hypothetical protein [Candidatus Sungbacteria bacterium]
MDTCAERAVQVFREKVGTFFHKRYDEGDQCASINLYDDVVAILETERTDVVPTLITLLGDGEASDMHYWIIAAMRGMGARGKLSRNGMQALLVHTESLGAGDYEEWYKSINTLGFSSEGADILLDFAENRLLSKCDIRGWRWLAFYIVGSLFQKHASLISASLKEKLRKEMEQETDPRQQKCFQEVLSIM